MDIKKILLIILLPIIFICKPGFPQESILWGNLKEGNYKVGLKVIEKYDTTRFINSGKAYRPIQMVLWYPSNNAGKEKPFLYKDYISLIAHEVNFKNSNDSSKQKVLLEYSKLLSSNGISSESIETLLSSKMKAHENAEFAAGSFPCIIVGQGNFHPAINLSILCEYLASHGYYVASCPSPMRISGPLKDTTQIYQFALDQKKDMEFIYSILKNYKFVNPDNLAVIGYSFGGRSAFLILNDFNNVKAFVSLDGGFADKIGKHWLDGIEINTGKISSPILHFYQDIESYVIPDFDLINSLNNSDRYLIKIKNMKHIFFSNLGMAVGAIPGFNFPGVNKSELKEKFELVCKASLGFLTTFMKNEEDSYWNKITKDIVNSDSLIEVKELKKK
jgi:dienelactone hydrolase